MLANIVNENNSGLHRNDELILLRNVNGQKMGRVKKNVIKIFKGVGFKIEIKTHHKKVSHYSFSMYAKFSQKTNICNTLICTRTCAYEGVTNVSFSSKLAYVLNECSLNFLDSTFDLANGI